MKKTTKYWLYFAGVLAFAAFANLRETPGIIAMVIIAILWLTDRGFRRLFDV